MFFERVRAYAELTDSGARRGLRSVQLCMLPMKTSLVEGGKVISLRRVRGSKQFQAFEVEDFSMRARPSQNGTESNLSHVARK